MFGNRLRELRENKGMTQANLAKALSISRSAIGMYEQGKREPDFETLEKIADYFNVTMDYLTKGKAITMRPFELAELFYGKEFFFDAMPQNDTERYLVIEFRKADKTTQDIVRKILGI